MADIGLPWLEPDKVYFAGPNQTAFRSSVFFSQTLLALPCSIKYEPSPPVWSPEIVRI